MSEELSPIKRALLEQRRLKARIEELETARCEPIAIIGMGCRFPGGVASPADLWRLLCAGEDAIAELPADRWDLAACYDPDPDAPGKIATRFGGFLQDMDKFDAHYFGISPREASGMDPQQRLLLEVGWSALEHAGQAPDTLAGSLTGIFIGVGPNDYFGQLVRGSPREALDAYVATGNAPSVASGRLAYLLGTHGPALSIDTACSSSLSAVHLACQNLRAGSCDMALAGGVSVILGIENFISLSRAHMMAPDGRCKAFDSRADGFVRSEGCGIVVLKRLSSAVRDGDRILAVIRGSACNQDGRSNGITAPNGPAQSAVIRAALADARTHTSEVGYVEAHGTGTALGDPIELGALTEVLASGRAAADELLVGSVKSNLGHMEAAAGIGGLIKCVLAIQHGRVPPNLHFLAPNPHVDWAAHPWLRIPAQISQWPATNGARVAGVSAFGFSGTNVHIVLAQAPGDEPVTEPARRVDRPQVLALSARSPEGLTAAASELARVLAGGEVDLADVCFTVNTARPSLALRAAFIAGSADEMRHKLASFANDALAAQNSSPVKSLESLSLYFPATVPRADDVARLRSDVPSFGAAYDAVAAQFPTVPVAGTAGWHLCVLLSLARAWESWGLRATSVVADAPAELAAAVHAGCVRLEDAIAALTDGRTLNCTAGRLPLYRETLAKRLGPGDVVRLHGASPVRADAEGRDRFELQVLPWAALLEHLAELFRANTRVDWAAFYRGSSARRIDVPTTPFIRRRHWFAAEGTTAALAGARLPTDLATAAAAQAAVLPLDADTGRFAALWLELDELTTFAVAQALAQLGLFGLPQRTWTVAELRVRLDVLPLYEILLERWLQRLAAAGLLVPVATGYRLVSDARMPARPTSAQLQAYPPLVRYMERCETALSSMVTGRCSPLEVLFPQNSLETGAFFYRDWALARYFNDLVAAVARAVASRGRPLRVLEIGAGTGGTTASVLPALEAGLVDYWFTDLSDFFFARAEPLRQQQPCVRFAVFDVDVAPASQGIPTGCFDVVIAANSVHACRDLPRALEHVRSLLAPGGLLLLYEATREFEWFDMSWGLVEGWQRHADDLRQGSPLLGASAWCEQLRKRGFAAAEAYPPDGASAEVLGHHVIVATADAARPMATASTTSRLVPVAASTGTTKVTDPVLLQRLRDLTPGERRRALETHVREHVMRVMRAGADVLPPQASDRLMNAGMDSLMAVELRNALSRELGTAHALPGTLIFDYPTIADIAGLLLTMLEPNKPDADAAPIAFVAPVAQAPDAAALIAELSEEDANAMLMEKLREFAQ